MEMTYRLRWHPPILLWCAGIFTAAVCIAIAFDDGLDLMATWWSREEYSHGYLIPAVSLFLIWQNADKLAAIDWRGSWLGVVTVLAGFLLLALGDMSAIYTVVQYAFLLTLAGVILALVGRAGMRYLWIPLIYLLFMIPLPNFLYFSLSSELQLISSQIGVAVTRLFNISVYLEGNVIDLGNYQLQVAEACSGLRYLFPLMSFGFLCAYLFKGAWWQRAVVFLSTIPITILMNSFRIGVIGVLVNRWGTEQAEGFLHYFEGWVIFMTCVVVLFAEMWLFARFSRPRRPLRDVFDFGTPSLAQVRAAARPQRLSAPFIAALVLLIAGVVLAQFTDAREEVVPERPPLTSFPLQVGDWRGRDQGIEQIYLDQLKLSDYIVANYRNPESEPGFVNLYVAYYESQRKGASVHSPRSCIPGGGWRITDFSQRQIANVLPDGSQLDVNRALITKGAQRQLVYYWFQQRGRHLTNEYAVKWFLFWDALTRNRSDGALVRVITVLPENSAVEKADAELAEFVKLVHPQLSYYLPD